jgi:hypothetical protein
MGAARTSGEGVIECRPKGIAGRSAAANLSEIGVQQTRSEGRSHSHSSSCLLIAMQQTDVVIGYLNSETLEMAPTLPDIRDGLSATGYVEGASFEAAPRL